MKLEPYIQFGGNCAQAFAYYQQHLGARDLMIMTFRGSPGEPGTSPDWLDKAMHASVHIDGQRLMGTDGMPGQPHTGMQGCSLTLSADTEVEAERIFEALSDKGKVTLPMETTFFARRFGMVTDQFGVAWMVLCQTPR